MACRVAQPEDHRNEPVEGMEIGKRQDFLAGWVMVGPFWAASFHIFSS